MTDLPAPKYQIIYADPPPGADLAELAELDIDTLADPDCLLFLWAKSDNLDRVMELGKGWGFRYATVAFVWNTHTALASDNDLGIIQQCLLCIVLKRGKIPQPRGARQHPPAGRASVLCAGEHGGDPGPHHRDVPDTAQGGAVGPGGGGGMECLAGYRD